MFVDSHCHLSFPELRASLPDIRAAMARERVDRALCICTTLEEFDTVHALALENEGFWCSAGVHPDNEGVREPAVADGQWWGEGHHQLWNQPIVRDLEPPQRFRLWNPGSEA